MKEKKKNLQSSYVCQGYTFDFCVGGINILVTQTA